MGHPPKDEAQTEDGQSEVARPVLIYDGDCGFCRLWVHRWRAFTGDCLEYAPYQEAASRFPQIPIENFRKAVQLILPGGEVFSAADAVFRTLAFAPGRGVMLWAYRRIPGVAAFTEWVYRLVAARRGFFSRLTRIFWGKSLEPPSYILTREIFLKLLGLVYLIAFLSLSTQIIGLVGRRGILPAAGFLEAVRENTGTERYWEFPTIGWLKAGDTSLRAMTLGGSFLSLLMMVGVARAPVLVLLWTLYLSLMTLGQDFMSFQWDILLLEAGFLAIFFAPLQIRPALRRQREPPRAVLWLLRVLLFRLMFSSGLAKLVSGDLTWRRLTALNYHYETQPLPTPLGWYASQLPAGFQKFCVVAMFFFEIALPFSIFAPRRARFMGAGLTIAFQLLIALTGNYTFFNLLAIVLCLLLFDDAALVSLLSRWLRERRGEARPRPALSMLRRILTAGLVGVMILAGVAEIPGVTAARRLPGPAARGLNVLRALRIVNRYGLFSVMTTSRLEIVIEGSNDAVTWSAYEFKYKPGDVGRAPPWVAPHQPRLDWQMWFAALGSYQYSPWFSNLMVRILQGSPDVLALLDKNPFPDGPPRYVRAVAYHYHFTDFAAKRATGAWWRREPRGLYFPVVRLP